MSRPRKRAKGMGGIWYHERSGRWQTRIVRDGQTFNPGHSFATEREAEAWLDQWLAEHPVGAALPERAPVAVDTSERVLGKRLGAIVADYLRECREGGAATSVTLGRLEGFPHTTSDPTVVREAAEKLSAKADAATDVLAELRIRQRVLHLRTAAGHLERVAAGQSARALFVNYAATWAERNGISYAAFREMGVAPDVLREAGIER